MLRRAVICWCDRNIDLLTGLDVIRPSAFEHTIAAAVEVRVLCEMVERVGRAVEAGRDIVTAIVRCQPVAAPGGGLRATRPLRIGGQ